MAEAGLSRINVGIEGKLPEEKTKFLTQIDYALKRDEKSFRNFLWAMFNSKFTHQIMNYIWINRVTANGTKSKC